MESGLYAAYSGLLARTEALDTAANNLSNASTPGFRAEREFYVEVRPGQDPATSIVGRSINSFSVLGGNTLDLGQGQLMKTGNPLDVAIQGKGFLGLKGADGIRYTRDGSLRRGTDGTLLSSGGEAVLSDSGKPLVVPTGDLTIAEDGSLSVQGAIVGKLGIYDPDSHQLSPEGVNRYASSDKTQAKQSSTAKIHQGSLESSNQDVIHGSLQLVLTQRQAEMMQKAVGLFQGTFEKVASEELARV